MRYLCVHCDKRFDHEGDKKPRCPECMRKHGIEPITDAKDENARPAWMMPAIAATVVAVVVGGYAYWNSNTPDAVSDEVAMAPLSEGELLGHIRRLSVDVTEEHQALLKESDAIEDFADEATGSASTAFDKAGALVDAIRERRSAGAFRLWSLSSPRDTPANNAAEAFEAIQEDDGRAQLYPLEVASVMVAALRSQDVDAMLAEIYSFPDDRAPPDPSGKIGYFGVAVYEGGAPDGDMRVFDPYGGRNGSPDEEDVRVINDVQALGAIQNHVAYHRLVREGEHEEAFSMARGALRLDPESAAIRSLRAAVLLTSGGMEEGVREMEAAAQLRPDAPRRNNLAGLHLAQQDLDSALREVTAALELHEDFAGAHATMAAIHLSNRELEEARASLERAEELDRDLPHLPMMWSNYYLATNEPDQAVEHALQAIDRSPHDWQARLSAARVLRAAGRFDEMREQARTVMEMVPESQRAQVEQMIISVLGDTALEEPLDEEEFTDEELGELPSSDFQLEESALLGGGDDSLGGSLLGDDSLGEGLGDTDLQLGDPNSFDLGGGDLRLNLD